MAMKTAFVNASLRTGCLIIGWINVSVTLLIIVMAVTRIASVYLKGYGQEWTMHPFIRLTAHALVCASSICLLYGANTLRRLWLLPIMAISPLDIAVTIVHSCVYISMGDVIYSTDIAVNFMLAASSSYFLCVIWSFYLELRHNEAVQKANQLQSSNATNIS